MKRLVACLLIVMFFVSGCGRTETQQDKIFRLVEKHYDTIVKACQEKDVETLCAIQGVTSVNIVEGYVVVFCKGTGIAPSSHDYGFYYSEENIPAMVDCNQTPYASPEDYTPMGNGYQKIVQENVFYTEQIKGNLYFYSNAY